MTTKFKLALAAITLGATALPAAAHHSYSMFDMQRTIVLEGTVVQFRWSNPHAFIRVMADVDGQAEEWSIEMTSPNNLALEGWTRRTVQQGDKVRIYVHPLRSGAQGAAYQGIRLADGSTLGTVE
jgi:hypothetical protein